MKNALAASITLSMLMVSFVVASPASAATSDSDQLAFLGWGNGNCGKCSTCAPPQPAAPVCPTCAPVAVPVQCPVSCPTPCPAVQQCPCKCKDCHKCNREGAWNAAEVERQVNLGHGCGVGSACPHWTWQRGTTCSERPVKYNPGSGCCINKQTGAAMDPPEYPASYDPTNIVVTSGCKKVKNDCCHPVSYCPEQLHAAIVPYSNDTQALNTQMRVKELNADRLENYATAVQVVPAQTVGAPALIQTPASLPGLAPAPQQIPVTWPAVIPVVPAGMAAPISESAMEQAMAEETASCPVKHHHKYHPAKEKPVSCPTEGAISYPLEQPASLKCPCPSGPFHQPTANVTPIVETPVSCPVPFDIPASLTLPACGRLPGLEIPVALPIQKGPGGPCQYLKKVQAEHGTPCCPTTLWDEKGNITSQAFGSSISSMTIDRLEPMGNGWLNVTYVTDLKPDEILTVGPDNVPKLMTQGSCGQLVPHPRNAIAVHNNELIIVDRSINLRSLQDKPFPVSTFVEKEDLPNMEREVSFTRSGLYNRPISEADFHRALPSSMNVSSVVSTCGGERAVSYDSYGKPTLINMSRPVDGRVIERPGEIPVSFTSSLPPAWRATVVGTSILVMDQRGVVQEVIPAAF